MTSYPASVEQVAQQLRVGAYVVCVRDDALLLVRLTHGGRWTLPGGGLDHGERPEDGAVREVAEETGYRVVLGPLIGVDSTRWERAHDGRRIDLHTLRILYTGEVVGGELRHEVGGSTDRAGWVPLAEVKIQTRTRLVDIALAAAARV